MGLIRSTKRVHARLQAGARWRLARRRYRSSRRCLPCGRACAATASARYEFPTFEAYISALPLLDRDEIAALALTLGILCFAVVTAILLVRTRRRLAEVEAAARDETVASKAAIDRAHALLLSEPQILVAWSAAADEPEIIGDPTLVTPATMHHACSPSAPGSSRTPPRDMEHSVDALRARGVSFAMTVTTLAGRIIEAEGQAIGGRAILRLREVSGIKYELAELARRHQKHVDDTAAMRALDRSRARPGLGARRRGQARLRQPGLCARGRGQGRRRGDRARDRAVRSRRRAASCCARTKRPRPMRAGSRPWSRGSAAAST